MMRMIANFMLLGLSVAGLAAAQDGKCVRTTTTLFGPKGLGSTTPVYIGGMTPANASTATLKDFPYQTLPSG